MDACQLEDRENKAPVMSTEWIRMQQDFQSVWGTVIQSGLGVHTVGHTQDHTVVQGRGILANVLACLKRADFEGKVLHLTHR